MNFQTTIEERDFYQAQYERCRQERDEARRLLIEFAWALEPCGDGGQARLDWKNRLYELDWFLPLTEEMEAKEEPDGHGEPSGQ